MTPNKTVREFRRFLREKGVDDTQYTNREIVELMDGEAEHGDDAGISEDSEGDADKSPDVTPEDLELAESNFPSAQTHHLNGTKSFSMPLAPSDRLSREDAFKYGKSKTQEISCGTCQFFGQSDSKCKLYQKIMSANDQTWALDPDVSAWNWCIAHMLGTGAKNFVSPMSALNESMGGALVSPPRYGAVEDKSVTPKTSHITSAEKFAHPGVFLFRHGKTKLNAGPGKNSPDIIRGWVDIPLDKDGIKDANEAAEEALKLNLSKLYSSDLRRAEQTADIIGKRIGLKPIRSMAFRPWHLGEFQGRPTTDSLKKLKWYTEHSDEKIPDGEAFSSFTDRFLKNLHKILEDHERSGENVGICCHFRNLKLTQAWLDAGMDYNEPDMETFWKDDVPTGSIVRVYKDKDDQWKWELYVEPSERGKKGRASQNMPLGAKSATPGGTYEPQGPGRFRQLAMEEEGQMSSPPTQEYLDINDLNQAMDRENSSAQGGPDPVAPDANEAREEVADEAKTTGFDLPADAGKFSIELIDGKYWVAVKDTEEKFGPFDTQDEAVADAQHRNQHGGDFTTDNNG